MSKPNSNSKFYFVGAGLGSLTGAAFLLRDCGFKGENIYILEALNVAGGSNDASGNDQKGYLSRGERMFSRQAYENFWDIAGTIPSVLHEGSTIKADMFRFSETHPCYARARLLDQDGQIMDTSSYGLSWKQIRRIFALILTQEANTYNKTIQDWFDDPSFYQTNYWYIYSTTFAFQPWSSLTEFRRYNKRFFYLMSRLNIAKGVILTEKNQYDTVIRPLKEYLEQHGVHFVYNTTVTDLEFAPGDGLTVTALRCRVKGQAQVISLNADDNCVVTLGCMTDNSSIGSIDRSPGYNTSYPPSAQLWKNIAAKKKGLGNPDPFFAHPDKSNWMTFNCTFNGTTLMDWLEKFTGNQTGEGLITTFTGTPWCLTMRNPMPPYFPDQPKHVPFMWVTSLYTDQIGRHVKKPMQVCTGAEILEEVLQSLPLTDELRVKIRSEVVAAIPVMLPYTDAHFLPRTYTDRPLVVPEGSTNLGLIGQYVEIPEDVVFTEEYSVRAARMAVYQLLGSDKKVAPVRKYHYRPPVFLISLRAFFRK